MMQYDRQVFRKPRLKNLPLSVMGKGFSVAARLCCRSAVVRWDEDDLVG
jgi:hypothetical protein